MDLGFLYFSVLTQKHKAVRNNLRQIKAVPHTVRTFWSVDSAALFGALVV